MPRVSPCISTRKFLTSNLYEIIIAKFKHALHKCNFSCPKSIIKWLKTIFKLFKILNSLIIRHGSVSQLPPPPQISNPITLYCICWKNWKAKIAFIDMIALYLFKSRFTNTFLCSVPELHHKLNALLLHFIDYHNHHNRFKICLIKANYTFVR